MADIMMKRSKQDSNNVNQHGVAELDGKISTTSRAKSNETFPEKLAETMRSPHVQDVLWWNREGTVFCLLPRQFTKLQNIFQGTKLESFQRKMKRWGFERCFDTSFPRGALVYHHPFFQRDRPELMKQMSAGMKKLTAVVKNEPSQTTVVAPSTTMESHFYAQPVPQQLLATERLRSSIQPTVRDLCRLPTVPNTTPLDPLLLHYLANRSNPALPPPLLINPSPSVDLSNISTLRLLQLRELLSRNSS
ncbi:hypothetical protein FisN_29Hu041 [Fistulifera solaris]|uniref:HSF-type DNA-binding domain-containing protein n=1 Tax=Fistulifera solaris TaxID=1519565 RepID=A0A1Z5K5U6_FISSO|nr:hypothetical protein FisN_29Hu041 [Fistulifera solaris]|eukprot:GAX21607.1 hypothetical protein FisN_29Hu041 [Fistulifera solaris]